MGISDLFSGNMFASEADRNYKLAVLSDGFGALRDNGGGSRQAPAALQALQQQQSQNAAREALAAAQGDQGGLPMGFNSPAFQAFAQQNPERAVAMMAQQAIQGPAARKIIPGADGYQYYADTQERVLPGVTKGEKPQAAQSAIAQLRQDLSNGWISQEDFTAGRAKLLDEGGKDRRIIKGADGRNYYADTQEPVLPGLQDVPKPADFDSETKLRKEFSAVSSDFRTVRDAYSRIESSAKDPSAAGDLAMIFNYMKVLDPGSVVRESEFATAANSAGVPDRIRATYNKVLSGERLADAQRADFLNRGQRLYQGRLEQYGKTETEYRRLAESYEFDPSRIVPDFNLPGGNQAIAAPPQGPRKTINGTVYEQRNGKWGKVP